MYPCSLAGDVTELASRLKELVLGLLDAERVVAMAG
jgi:hypothetical protein